MSTAEREWEQLSLDEKLTELGFPRNAVADFDPNSLTTQARLHAALDQLLDCGGLLTEVEAMAQPFVLERSAKAKTGDEDSAVDVLKRIYGLVTAGD